MNLDIQNLDHQSCEKKTGVIPIMKVKLQTWKGDLSLGGPTLTTYVHLRFKDYFFSPKGKNIKFIARIAS